MCRWPVPASCRNSTFRRSEGGDEKDFCCHRFSPQPLSRPCRRQRLRTRQWSLHGRPVARRSRALRRQLRPVPWRAACKGRAKRRLFRARPSSPPGATARRDELYNLVKASMPYGNGNSLDADTYRRIVGFVLAANGAKPGRAAFTGAEKIKLNTVADGRMPAEMMAQAPAPGRRGASGDLLSAGAFWRDGGGLAEKLRPRHRPDAGASQRWRLADVPAHVSGLEPFAFGPGQDRQCEDTSNWPGPGR